MSYINNHKAAYEKLQSIEEVDAQHISLYHAFFYQFNKFGWPDYLLIPRDNLMFMAKIGSTNTFYKKVRQLDKWGFIKYKPSKNPLIGSRYTYIKCDTSGDTSTDTSTDTSGGISTDTSGDTSSETLIRPKDYKTKRPKDKCKYQFSDLWDDYDLGGRAKGSKKQAEGYWAKLSVEEKEAAVELRDTYLKSSTDKDGNVYGRQVKYYLRDKEWVGLPEEGIISKKNHEPTEEEIIEQCISQHDAKIYIRQIEEKHKFKLDKVQLAKDYLKACKQHGKSLNPSVFPGWVSMNQLWIIDKYKPES